MLTNSFGPCRHLIDLSAVLAQALLYPRRHVLRCLPQYTATLPYPCVASRAFANEASVAMRSASTDTRDIFALRPREVIEYVTENAVMTEGRQSLPTCNRIKADYGIVLALHLTYIPSQTPAGWRKPRGVQSGRYVTTTGDSCTWRSLETALQTVDHPQDGYASDLQPPDPE